jgi:HAE1 family hydrophobic/amphiphilic exporter-1
VIEGAENARLAAWMNETPAIIVNVRKQPGANVIEVVDRVKQLLPSLTATLPASIETHVLTDRTTTIRASVHDTQLELLLAVALVVAVIFIFLRSATATLIPAAAVPLSIVGTFGVMYLAGFSVNNLTLMALTIATGFVVDDAIVVIENIARYVEEGETPMEAALKGSAQIAFTIISLTVSLVAVLIPLLFMPDVVGRLFREFAITLAVAILISAAVSLTLTPMMAARLLRHVPEEKQGRLFRKSGELFERLIERYSVALNWVLDHQPLTLIVFLVTFALTVILYIIIPKGFFPQQDNGMILGTSEAAQDISFDEMKKKQEELARIVMADPAVYSIAMFIGGGGSALNNGRMYVTLKPRDERDASAQQVIARLRPKLDKVEGARQFLQASQDVRLGGRATRTQFEYTLQDANLDELNTWAPKVLKKLQTLPQLRDVATDQQTNGTTLTLKVDRDAASRYGISPQLIDDTLYDAFGQRQVAQYFTQLNSYHVILEILPELQGKVDTLDKIYVKSPLTGEQVPLSVFAKWTTVPVRPLSISHQGQFPAITISFNLAQGVALGQATDAVQNAMRELGTPATLNGSFQGTAQAFQQSLGTVPLLILAALVVVYLILGILYESYIHPITILSTLPSAGVGALATLMLFGYDFSLIALIGIVKKNGIMMVDFAIAAEREEHLSPEESIRKAALLRFRPIMMTTMAAMLGGVPLMLGTGTGAEIRQPLGYAMVGGLAVSQALTLFTTPVVYLYLDQFSNWLSGWGRAGASDDRNLSGNASVKEAAE